MTSLGAYVLITCPYADCKYYGATDANFKRVPRHAALFACPKCGRKFSAFKDRKGNIVTVTPGDYDMKATRSKK